MVNQDYTGYQYFTPTEEELGLLYNGTFADFEKLNPQENEYFLIQNQNGETIDYFKFQGGRMTKLAYPVIRSRALGDIKPRNGQQHLAMDLLKDKEVKVKILRGVYGSGKDLLMFCGAMELIEKGKFEKIVYVRPNVGVADVPDIGALPGTAEEKLDWTLGPLYDKVGGPEGMEMLMRDRQIEMVPLQFIRGRSFENSIVYVCEAQNMTSEIAKLVISRIGEGSELWLNGDTHQTDKRVYDRDNGITKMVSRLAGEKLFGYVYLPITERSDVARLADKLDD